MLGFRGKIAPINIMNITKELEQIDARIWGKYSEAVMRGKIAWKLCSIYVIAF
jgi:hypothetical protein